MRSITNAHVIVGGRKLGENFYSRGDGTRTYFFSLESSTSLFAQVTYLSYLLVYVYRGELGTSLLMAIPCIFYKKKAGFEQLHLEYDTRELRNRKRKISMYRVWIVGKFKKPISISAQ